MLRRLLIFIFLFMLIPPVYSYSNPPKIYCDLVAAGSPDSSSGCFLVFYNIYNSHAALCDQNAYLPSYMGYIKCWIDSNDTDVNVQIPVNFAYGNNCNLSQPESILAYLYYSQNSHLSLEYQGNLIPVCFSQDFAKALGKDTVSHSNGDFLFGVYKNKNTHFIPDPSHSFLANNLTYIYIKYYGSPNTTLYPANESFLTSPLIFFEDNDTIKLYKCFYRVITDDYDSGWIERTCYNFFYKLNVSAEEVWIYSKVINIAGYSLTKAYKYYLYSQGLYLESLSGKSMDMVITEGKRNIYFRIGNRQNRTIENITFSYSVTESAGQKSYTTTNCTQIQSLGPYEYKDCYIEIYPYTIGYYTIEAKVQGQTIVANQTVLETDSEKVSLTVSTDIKRTILSADTFATFWLSLFFLTSIILLLL